MDKKEEVGKKKTRAFIMEQDTALIFFKLVHYYTKVLGHEDSEKLRTHILNELARIGKMKTVFDTGRSEDQIIDDYKKKGLNILDERDKKHKSLPKLPKLKEKPHDVSRRNAGNNKRNIIRRTYDKLAELVISIILGGSK